MELFTFISNKGLFYFFIWYLELDSFFFFFFSFFVWKYIYLDSKFVSSIVKIDWELKQI